jgi:predicted PurR-regulated permease PerM
LRDITTAFAMIPFAAWLAFTVAAIVTISGGGSGIAAAGVFLWGSIVMLAGDHFVWPTLVSDSARLAATSCVTMPWPTIG